MCKACENLAKEMVGSGRMTEEELMSWFWNETPWPVGSPLLEQVEKLKKEYPTKE